MLRILLYVVLLALFTRAMIRLWHGIIEGFTGQSLAGAGVPRSGVRMVRDPICGTFVVPDRAMAHMVRGEQVYFCSAACRDKYRGSSSAARPQSPEGRTA